MAKKTPAADKVKTMSLPRYTLALLYTLLNVPLHGPQLRARNFFAKMVRTELEQCEELRVKMVEDVADKDPETHAPLRKPDGSEYVVQPENLKVYQEKFDKHMHDPWIVDLNQATRSAIVGIKTLVLETKQGLGTVDGYAFEDIANAFESI